MIKKFGNQKRQIKICTLSEKSFFLYSSILSIILSRNIWIPIDSELPRNIIKYILSLSKADIVLVDHKNEKKFCNFLKKNKVNYINIEKIKFKTSSASINTKNYKDEDESMIFFTSGSTGYPKGVLMTNKNFISSLKGQMKHIFNKIKNKNLVFGDYHNTSFVILLNILFPCLLLKGRISYAKNKEDKINPVIDIVKNNVNCIITLPSTLNRIRIFNNNFSQLNLKALILCGEPFYYDSLNFILTKLKPDNLFNSYGSTELSPWVFAYKYENKDHKNIKKVGLMPIGKKFYNVNYRFKNQELLIHGPMVNSYLIKSQNAKNHLISNGKTWFLTKDKIKKIKNLIYVIGRSDSVIKLRGFRIELRGIEAKIREFKGVKNCFVFVTASKNKKIVAAIETNDNDIVDKLENFLSKNLQNYMIPKKFVTYINFPKNKNEKIVREKIKKNNKFYL